MCAQQIKTTEPELDVEFTQVLQDMIGDLSNAPEPIQIKIFSNDPELLAQLGPRVGDAIARTTALSMSRTESTTRSAARPPTSRSIPSLQRGSASRRRKSRKTRPRFSTAVATTDPLIANGRPYTIRVRLGDETPQLARRNREHGLQQRFGPHGDARLAGRGRSSCRRKTKSVAKICSGLSSSPAAWKARTWAQVWPRFKQTVAGLHLPASVRVEYGGTYEEQQKSFRDLLRVLLLALALVFGVLLAEFRNFPAPIAILTSSVLSISGVICAC